MSDPQHLQHLAILAGPPKLNHDELLAAQKETLDTPRRPYGQAARLLFKALNAVYGQERTLGKFKVLELVARVPYQSWEQIAYIAITHIHEKTGIARKIYERVAESRAQQDNEQWHLLIIQEMFDNARLDAGKIKFFWVPQILAWGYYQLSWFLFVVRPDWSYLLNADFEDHAEHEYMELVTEHPEWEHTPFISEFADDYGPFDSRADLFRQIGHDERVHKIESLNRLKRRVSPDQAPCVVPRASCSRAGHRERDMSGKGRSGEGNYDGDIGGAAWCAVRPRRNTDRQRLSARSRLAAGTQ